MYILGIHAALNSQVHDPGAALFKNGNLIAAIEEERLSRTKTSLSLFPEKSIDCVLRNSGISIRNVKMIGADGETWASRGLNKIQRYLLSLYGYCPEIRFFNHAVSHLAGAFFASPFKKALCCSFDGSGDGLSGLIGVLSRETPARIKILKRFNLPNSLGRFYSSMTNYLGFRGVEEEYKMMGLAAYGEPKLELNEFLKYVGGGDFRSNPQLIIRPENLTSAFEPICNFAFVQDKIKIPPRRRNDPLLQKHFDLAASVQKTFTQVYIQIIKYWLKKTEEENLVLAGGCALNCLANQQLLNLNLKDFYIFPAASDRGLCIGNGFLAATILGQKPRPLKNVYLGPSYSSGDIHKAIKASGLRFLRISRKKNIYKLACNDLKKGLVLGWYFGRGEMGPRALGARSIIGLASFSGMQKKINMKIKFRESFRPFAPALLLSDGLRRGLIDKKIAAMKYMTTNIKISKNNRSYFKEATAVDCTARVQFVEKGDYFEPLLQELKKIEKFPVIINTSFNLAGEPNVETPTDALRTFVSSKIDKLYFEKFIVLKSK